MPEPVVSVLLPTYNRGALLLDAARSVLAQTYHAWELIVADDGSTDGSLERLPDDRRIRVLRLPHCGNVACVRQAALEAAGGAYIGCVDSDDRWRPEKLQRQLARLQASPLAGWCFGDYTLVDAAGTPMPLRAGVPSTRDEGSLFARFVSDTAGISLQTVLVQTELARAVGFDARVPFGDDLDFMIRLSLLAPACCVPEILAEVRQHAGRGSAGRQDLAWHMARAFWRYRRLAPEPSLRRACGRRAAGYVRIYVKLRAGL